MISVAIDGPSGAGKSTVAKLIAREFGYIYVDTGAMYRAVAVYFLENKKNIADIEQVVKALDDIKIKIEYINKEQHMFLNGVDVTGKLRTPSVSMAASDVSAIKEVREFLLLAQKDMAKKFNVIMDGRDIATVVLPDADVKIFLTASPEQRAKRRYDELKATQQNVSYEEVMSDMKLRDYNDSNRKTAPLKPSEESIIVDSTNLSLYETVKFIKDLIEEKTSGK